MTTSFDPAFYRQNPQLKGIEFASTRLPIVLNTNENSFERESRAPTRIGAPSARMSKYYASVSASPSVRVLEMPTTTLRVIYDFEGENSDEMTAAAGTILFGIIEQDGWWLVRKGTGTAMGLIPTEFVEKIRKKEPAIQEPETVDGTNLDPAIKPSPFIRNVLLGEKRLPQQREPFFSNFSSNKPNNIDITDDIAMPQEQNRRIPTLPPNFFQDVFNRGNSFKNLVPTQDVPQTSKRTKFIFILIGVILLIAIIAGAVFSGRGAGVATTPHGPPVATSTPHGPPVTTSTPTALTGNVVSTLEVTERPSIFREG